MKATKNAKFPFITVTSANVEPYGIFKASGLGVFIYDNSNKHMVSDCKNLVYHIDAHTAKTYNKHLIDTI